jgi:uncharacterized protein YecA (UPF0149 family)
MQSNKLLRCVAQFAADARRYNDRIVGLNAPCPYASGKKFKPCHGAPH